MVELLALGVLGVFGVLGVCVFKCGSPAIRGRRSVIQQILTFSGALAEPTWERSLEGLLEGVLEGRLRGNMLKSFRKFQEIVPRPSKIQANRLQIRALEPPR